MLVLAFSADEMLYTLDGSTTWWDLVGYDVPNPQIEDLVGTAMQSGAPDTTDAIADGTVRAASVVLTLLWDWAVPVGPVFAMIYCMFRWTTKYNLENFGCRSKREWKRRDPAQRNVEEEVADAGRRVAAGFGNLGKRAAGRVPSGKMRGYGASAADKATWLS